ncbi:MAG: hypothetical protein ACK5X3_08125, partial [Pseudomonadota bacterium]
SMRRSGVDAEAAHGGAVANPAVQPPASDVAVGYDAVGVDFAAAGDAVAAGAEQFAQRLPDGAGGDVAGFG